MADTYNGWTNYETWNVALWIGNEQSSSEYWAEQADDVWGQADADATFTREERAVLELAERLKDEFEEAWQDIADRNKIGASVWGDLMGAALSEVNWREIAENLIESMEKPTEEAAEHLYGV